MALRVQAKAAGCENRRYRFRLPERPETKIPGYIQAVPAKSARKPQIQKGRIRRRIRAFRSAHFSAVGDRNSTRPSTNRFPGKMANQAGGNIHSIQMGNITL